jgi:hypothetical protein
MLLQQHLVALVAVVCLYSHFVLAFSVNVRQNGVKIMIVGDSISHGAEGDCLSLSRPEAFVHR